MEKNFYCVFVFALSTIIFAIIPHPCVAKAKAKANTSSKSLATDQAALLAFKSHITSDPASHIIATNWTNSSSVCSWHGVTCSLRHQRVAALNLSSMNLSGTIPPQLGHLSFLVSLDLTSNNFSGTLPQELSLLHRLKVIDLYLNNFTGDIPSLFGRLTKLEYLSLRNNSFTGSIPKSLSNLTNLQTLVLTFNSLSGDIPEEFRRLQRLKYLGIEYNDLSGGIPSAIFNISSLVSIAFTGNELNGSLPPEDIMCTNLPYLSGIYLSENRLSGVIPTNLSQCSQLQYLSLSYNSFSGQIPAEIGHLTSLQELGLGGNNLNGVLPNEIGNLRNLVVFGVERNQIGGSLPLNIFINMSSLQTLALSRNKFIGKLFSRDVGNLTMLKGLYLDENYLTGVIPREFDLLFQLEELNLGFNNLSGSIPNELFNISTLQTLEFSFNDLSGRLPANLCHGSPILEGFYLGGNSVTGAIPNSISNCSQLRILTLNLNEFSGYIPTHLGNLRLLERLELFGNNLTAAPSSSELSFITSLTNCKFLTQLSIFDNPLYGVIPPSVGNLSSSFQIFYGSNCRFEGNIPVEIGNLNSLVILVLQDNNLSGKIPLTIKHLHGLQGLDLSYNLFEGSFPEAICDLNSLVLLYIRRNRLSGPIPQCLGNVSSLRDIFLDFNIFNSSIPSSLWGLRDLTNLDLSSNLLSGVLPQEIGNLGGAVNIDLSMNKLSGSIPTTIGKLQNLANLSLANNRLEGSIPVSVGSMISLVSLDLSYNNLSGLIPKSLEALRYLNYFNVSFNSLRGEIPDNGSFRNFTMDSFMGNEALCGIPKFQVRICHAASNHRSKKKVLEIALFTVLGAVGFITVVSLAFIFVRYKRKNKTTRQVDELISIAPQRISYYELMHATGQFNECNLIGSGSSCSVYRGILNSGMAIAVKVFNFQLEGISRRFDVECEILRSIRHRNLTSVISSCSNEEFKALVLEYMPNGNLEKWLYSHNYCLNVMERLNIMIDVACALEYLHHGYSTPIVHSDLKPSNVLLDEDMVAHVSDFGIAKLLGNGDSVVLTNTLATLGYIAPEYGLEGLVSTRCDVYSYGVLLIEIFTRKRPCDDMFSGDLSLKCWVENSLLEVAVEEVIDINLVMNLEGEEFEKNVQCVSSILEVALKCCMDSAGDRINMKEANAKLQKIKRQFSQ